MSAASSNWTCASCRGDCACSACRKKDGTLEAAPIEHPKTTMLLSNLLGPIASEPPSSGLAPDVAVAPVTTASLSVQQNFLLPAQVHQAAQPSQVARWQGTTFGLFTAGPFHSQRGHLSWPPPAPGLAAARALSGSPYPYSVAPPWQPAAAASQVSAAAAPRLGLGFVGQINGPSSHPASGGNALKAGAPTFLGYNGQAMRAPAGAVHGLAVTAKRAEAQAKKKARTLTPEEAATALVDLKILAPNSQAKPFVPSRSGAASSGFRGVSSQGQRWRARICVQKLEFTIGE